jgi:AcrR family transcriptional regulator
MSPSVKRRAYHSPVRDEQALATRRRMLEAAERLFVEVGYARATIKQIARAAQVSEDLVFHSFGTKRGLLEAVMAAAAGTEGPGATLAGPGPEGLRPEPSLRGRIDELAAAVGDQLARARPLDDMLRSAAAVDPELDRLRSELHLRQRRRSMTRLAAWIGEQGALRQPVEEAAALVWTLTSPEVHHMLVDGWQWPHAQYVAWLRDNLEAGLLAADSTPDDRPAIP